MSVDVCLWYDVRFNKFVMQLQIMDPPVAEELLSDSLKLSLMNPGRGGCHFTQCF